MIFNKSPQQIHKELSIASLTSDAIQDTIPPNFPFSVDDLKSFEENITGKIVYPWSNGYDTDKQDFNNAYPVNPLMIIYAANYGDVRESLAIARNRPGGPAMVAIRSGGHSLAGYSVCQGVVIDISNIKNISVNPAAKIVKVDAGCTFGDLFPTLEFYGLHMVGGGCPTVAVAGYMQGGGYGMTSRTYGMQCDCVLEVQVMLADGSIVTANKSQNQDLYWAVCGGTGGNFGVLLNITYQLVTLGEIWGIKAEWDISANINEAAQALYTIQNTYLAPDVYLQLGIQTVLNIAKTGEKRINFLATWTGNADDMNTALAPLLSLPGTNVVYKKQGRYSAINSDLLEGVPPLPANTPFCGFSRSIYIERFLTQADWVDILNFYLTAIGPYTIVDMEGYGGKINQIPLGSNAFIHRTPTMDFFCDVFFNDQTNDRKEQGDWLESFFQFMEKYGNGQSYQNYPNRKQQNFQWAYWTNYYNVLVGIKKKYDPGNFFHYQQSIGTTEEEIIGDAPDISFEKTDIVYENF
jgi:FAD/FMN-containing dehydrogenase